MAGRGSSYGTSGGRWWWPDIAPSVSVDSLRTPAFQGRLRLHTLNHLQVETGYSKIWEGPFPPWFSRTTRTLKSPKCWIDRSETDSMVGFNSSCLIWCSLKMTLLMDAFLVWMNRFIISIRSHAKKLNEHFLSSVYHSGFSSYFYSLSLFIDNNRILHPSGATQKNDMNRFRHRPPWINWSHKVNLF